MPQQTKIFRVFVSSTFSDMQEERHILQNEVFPKLEKLCNENNARFQAVDLRWGVTEASQLNQKTLEICLNEVARCQRISPKPNFLILLGDRYGWQPIPESIPEDEWNIFKNHIDSEDLKLLSTWYKKDENAIPAEYVLQARTDEYSDYKIWSGIDAQIKRMLRQAVAKTDLSNSQKLKYFTSATHQEIVNGALNPPSGLENPGNHVFAYERKATIDTLSPSAGKFIDMENDQQDMDTLAKLNALKGDLKDLLQDNYISYDAAWKDDRTRIMEPTQFADIVFQKLKSIIEKQLEVVIDKEEIKHEVNLQTKNKNQLTRHFKGRAGVLNTISDYLKDESKQVLSLIGASGSGKSSVMAKAIQTHEQTEKDGIVLFRFLGTTSASSSSISIMQSLAGQIAREFGKELKDFITNGDEKVLHDQYGMAEVFVKTMSLATTNKPIIIFLDALDQLSDTKPGYLSWMPKDLPANTKLVVSALPEYAASLESTNTLDLPVLPPEEAEVILEGWLESVNRRLTREQFDYIIYQFSKTSLPIYLKLAFEIARHWTSYKTDIDLCSSVDCIITNFFKRLELEFPDRFVEHAVCYMLSGRYQGLAENEILDILAFDEEHWELFLNQSHQDHREELRNAGKIPMAVWSRLYLELEPFLTERDADGIPIITFFHRQFVEVLVNKYGL